MLAVLALIFALISSPDVGQPSISHLSSQFDFYSFPDGIKYFLIIFFSLFAFFERFDQFPSSVYTRAGLRHAEDENYVNFKRALPIKMII